MVIVACVDHRDHASEIISEAASLAASFGEPLHVVHVLTREQFVDLQQTSVSDTGSAVSVDRIEEVAADIAADALDDEPTDGEAVGLVGKPDEEVVSYADEHDARYIVLGGRDRSPVGKALFGSVAQSVLRESERPVLLVHSRAE